MNRGIRKIGTSLVVSAAVCASALVFYIVFGGHFSKAYFFAVVVNALAGLCGLAMLTLIKTDPQKAVAMIAVGSLVRMFIAAAAAAAVLALFNIHVLWFILCTVVLYFSILIYETIYALDRTRNLAEHGPGVTDEN